MSIPYTKVTSILCQTLSKKDTTWKIDLEDLRTKNEEFYNSSIKKILTTINGMPHQLFAAGLQAIGIYPELKKYFYKEHSNVTWEEILTTKFGLWIDTRSSTDNTLHGSGRAVGKSSILLQIEKAAESSDGDLTCHVLSLENDPSGILTIGK